MFVNLCSKLYADIQTTSRWIAWHAPVRCALRQDLRKRGYLPIVFDFRRGIDRDLTETIKTLVGLCKFAIVDITRPKSSPLELEATVKDYQVPFVPIIERDEKAFSMFADFRKYHWMLWPPFKISG